MLNIRPMQLTHASEFRIILDDDHIILHGTAEESVGAVLRGSVVLNCHEQTKVKAITLKFLGVTNIHWVEGRGPHQTLHKTEKTIIEKEWTFLASQKKSYTLSQGQHKWDFEIPLPGNLPESVHHEMGQVSYRLKAYCDRPTLFSMNYVNKRTIKVTRHMPPSSFIELSQPIVISNVWANKVNYNISIPSKVYGFDKTIPMSFSILPIAPNLTIRFISCSLKEYTTCYTLDRHCKTEGRVISHLQDDHISISSDSNNGDERWIKTELLHVPAAASNHIKYDMCTDLIQIKHKLKFTVALQNADGHISELRAVIPIIIVPMVPGDDGNDLPAYEEALQSIPYYDASIFSSDTSNYYNNCNMSSDAGSSPASLMSDCSSIRDDDVSTAANTIIEPLTWMGMDICRVPSYGTASRSVGPPCNLASSLPTYDQAVVA